MDSMPTEIKGVFYVKLLHKVASCTIIMGTTTNTGNIMILNKLENVLVREVELHELCEMHPIMSDSQFEALKDSLNLNGQQKPITLYRGKVIDGRHRIKAMIELDKNEATAEEVPRNTKMDEVKAFVRASETRRHQSVSQLACNAYLALHNPKSSIKTASEAAIDFGVSKRDVSYCVTIANACGSDVIKALALGEKASVPLNGSFKSYTSIRSLYNAITRDKKSEMMKPTASQSISKKDADHWVRDNTLNDNLESFSLKIESMKERYEYEYNKQNGYDNVAG